MRNGGNLHFRRSSSHSVFSFTLYIYSSFIRYRDIYYKKSNSLACSLTVSSNSSLRSAFSLCISFSSFVADFSFYRNFLMILRQSSTSSDKLLYCFSFSNSSSSCRSFSASNSNCFYFSSSNTSCIFLWAWACSRSFSSRALPPVTSWVSIYFSKLSRSFLFLASSCNAALVYSITYYYAACYSSNFSADWMSGSSAKSFI